jgi:CPA1 family monovalent cation:H+ antiporter
VLDWLGLTRRDPLASAVSEHQARLVTARAARAELDTLLANGMVPRMAYERLRSEYQVTIADAEREIRRIQERNLAQGARLLLAVRRRLLDAERAALSAAGRTGLIDPEVAERHLLRLDERTLGLERLLQETGDAELHPARESAP